MPARVHGRAVAIERQEQLRMTTQAESRPSSKSAPAATWVPPARQNLYDLERTSLRELIALVESRSSAESVSLAAFAAATTGAEKELGRARKHINNSKDRDLTALSNTHQESLRQIQERYKSESDAADAEFAETKRTVTSECNDAELKARTAHQDARW